MRAVRVFVRSWSGALALAILALLLIIAILGPPLFSSDAAAFHFTAINQGASGAHLFGTDELGRDVFWRLIVATRVSLEEALAAVGLGAAIGLPVGAATVVLPQPIRRVVLRVIDAMIAFPALIIAIYVAAVIGASETSVIIGVGAGLAFAFARMSSTLMLAVAGRDHIAAARLAGVTRLRLVTRHVLPSVADVLAVGISVGVAGAIVAAAGLSFLGLGIRSPQYDWGGMLTSGVNSFYETPAAGLGPALFIAVAALGFGFFGEAVAHAANPVLWTRGARPRRAAAKITATSGHGVASAPAARASAADAAASGMSAGDDAVLDVRGLYVSLHTSLGERDIVKGLSFSARRGEALGIVGESGSGKTLTALALADLLPTGARRRGQITLRSARADGHPTALSKQARRRRGRESDADRGALAMVFQDPTTSLNPALRLGVQLTEAVRMTGWKRRDCRALAESRLAEMGIPEPAVVLGKYPYQLSGGMRQRAMIAMALMNEIDILVADEPTTALDVTIQAQIMELFSKIMSGHGMALLLISHNLGLIRQQCSRVIVLYAGVLVEELPTERLAIDPLHPYTRALMDAVPELTRPRESLVQPIRGEPANPAESPSGCPFQPRCPLAMAVCATQMPTLVEVAAQRRVACWAATGVAE